MSLAGLTSLDNPVLTQLAADVALADIAAVETPAVATVGETPTVATPTVATVPPADVQNFRITSLERDVAAMKARIDAVMTELGNTRNLFTVATVNRAAPDTAETVEIPAATEQEVSANKYAELMLERTRRDTGRTGTNGSPAYQKSSLIDQLNGRSNARNNFLALRRLADIRSREPGPNQRVVESGLSALMTDKDMMAWLAAEPKNDTRCRFTLIAGWPKNDIVGLYWTLFADNGRGGPVLTPEKVAELNLLTPYGTLEGETRI